MRCAGHHWGKTADTHRVVLHYEREKKLCPSILFSIESGCKTLVSPSDAGKVQGGLFGGSFAVDPLSCVPAPKAASDMPLGYGRTQRVRVGCTVADFVVQYA